MEGKEAIIAKILEGARSAADNLVRDAQIELTETEMRAQMDAQKDAEIKSIALQSECQQIIARKITLANLDSRKLILLEKQTELNKVYFNAEKKLIADSKVYADFMASLVVSNAEDGDEVVVGETDKDILNDKWFGSLTKKTDAKITYAKESHKSKGVILSGKESDKNLTLAAIMKDVRTRTETQTAKILFGDKN